jgi:hypothetical protein
LPSSKEERDGMSRMVLALSIDMLIVINNSMICLLLPHLVILN